MKRLHYIQFVNPARSMNDRSAVFTLYRTSEPDSSEWGGASAEVILQEQS
ncbi:MULTISPECIES: hypothetical protein [unclassified Paenibacillus]